MKKIIPLFPLSILVMAFSCNSTPTSTGSAVNSETNAPVQMVKTYLPTVKAALVQLFTFSAIKGGKKKTKEGTNIIIPENCFVDKSGKPVTGEVTLEFAQYDTPMEIIASGIPMTIKVDGKETAFESAGMFQINGKAAGEDIYVAKGKSIQVELSTCYRDTNYSFYQFDEKKGAWATLMEPEELNKVTGKGEITEEAEQKIIADAGPKPIEIKAFPENTPVFELNINTKDIEGLDAYKNIMWTYTGNGRDPFKEPDFFTTQWENTSMVPSPNVTNAFDMTCKSGSKSFSTTVKPVLFGNQLKKAQSEYKRLIDSYNRRIEALKKQATINKTNYNASRMLNLSNFGVYNCDRTWPRHVTEYTTKALAANFGKDITSQSGIVYYVVNPDINSAVYLYSTASFRYRTDCENYLMAVLPNNEVAICKPDQFDKKFKNNGSHDVDFTTGRRTLTPESQFTDLLLD